MAQKDDEFVQKAKAHRVGGGTVLYLGKQQPYDVLRPDFSPIPYFVGFHAVDRELYLYISEQVPDELRPGLVKVASVTFNPYNSRVAEHPEYHMFVVGLEINEVPGPQRSLYIQLRLATLNYLLEQATDAAQTYGLARARALLLDWLAALQKQDEQKT
jgi:hypothetical protein